MLSAYVAQSFASQTPPNSVGSHCSETRPAPFRRSRGAYGSLPPVKANAAAAPRSADPPALSRAGTCGCPRTTSGPSSSCARTRGRTWTSTRTWSKGRSTRRRCSPATPPWPSERPHARPPRPGLRADPRPARHPPRQAPRSGPRTAGSRKHGWAAGPRCRCGFCAPRGRPQGELGRVPAGRTPLRTGFLGGKS